MHAASIASLFLFQTSLFAADWSCPAVPSIAELPYPRIAASPAELDRLRKAYRGEDRAAQNVVIARIREADAALKHPLEFPPRGGQHNQWYQCDKCQLALKTVDHTRHECPSCKKVYSGAPYDDVVFARTHHGNLRHMSAAAWAHAITGEEKYGRFAAEVLLGYAARYRDYPYHSAHRQSGIWHAISGGHLFEQTLTEASAMASYIAPAYDLICAGDVLSDDERRTIREGLLSPMLKNIAKNRSGKSNWQTWHNAAMLAGGSVLGDNTWVERAISEPGNGFVAQMQISVSDDGMWYENSWGYHFYTLRAMTLIVEYARRLGVDLWSHPRLRSMYTVPVDYAMPNGRLPRFGDDVNTSLGSAAHALEFAYHAYRDPDMVAHLPTTPTWDSIMLGRVAGKRTVAAAPKSKVFPSAGHAIIRSGGPKGLVSVMTFGPYGGFHGHFDKLSFVFYAYGKELGVDPGRARSQAYRLLIHREWYKASLSHNAVIVDGRSQSPATGRLLHFKSDPSYTLVVANCDDAYQGVVHTRLLLQTADYLLVFDDLRADKQHRFDWYYHNRGRFADEGIVQHLKTSAAEDTGGMQYVKNRRIVTTDDAVRLTFDTEGVMTRLMLDASPQTAVLVGDGVGGSVLDRVPLVRVTRRGRRVRFAAAFEPVSDGVTATVRDVVWREHDGRIEVEVIRDQGRDVIRTDVEWNEVELQPDA